MEETPDERRPRPGAWWAVLLLALLQAGLLLDTAWDKSDTGDEPVYLAAGALQWVHGDFGFNCEAPVVPKWGFALALRLVDPTFTSTPERRDWVAKHLLWSRTREEMRRSIMAARCATIVVAIATGVLLWRLGRRDGEAIGLLAQALWTVSPTVLGNAALATLDPWAAFAVTALALATVRWIEKPRPGRAVLAGVCAALGLASKFTAGVAIPVALVVAACAAWRRVTLKQGVAALAAFLGAVFLALWACYGFTVGTVSTASLAEAYGGQEKTYGPLPFPMWFQGVLQQSALAGRGHLAYIDGQIRSTGWWWFYLAALGWKTTLGAQALVLLRLVAWMRSRPSLRELAADAAILGYPLLLFLALSTGRTQTGIRYLVPAYPLGMLWAARTLVPARRAFGGVGAALPWLAVACSAAAMLRVHPHHLMFFNTWAGGPDGGPRHLIVGDDWGQDMRRLGVWMEERSLPSIWYAQYAGMPGQWGITFRSPPCVPKPGIYALQAVEVHRPRRIDAGCLDWLTVEPPDEKLGWSIYIYVVDRSRIERLRAERGTVTPFWKSGE